MQYSSVLQTSGMQTLASHVRMLALQTLASHFLAEWEANAVALKLNAALSR